MFKFRITAKPSPTGCTFGVASFRRPVALKRVVAILGAVATCGARRRVQSVALLATLLLSVSGCGGTSAQTSSTTSANPSIAVTNGTSRKPMGPVPKGRIVFVRKFDSGGTSGALFDSGAEGSNEHQLTHPKPDVIDDQPNWSPDGTHLVLTRIGALGTEHESHQLITVAANGSDLRVLTNAPPGRAGFVQGFDGDGAFSPDGGRIAYIHAFGKVENDQLEHSNVFVMEADGKHPRQVSKFPAFAGDAGGVAWSPDGKKLVFAFSNANGSTPAGGRALFVINVDGSGQRQLTPWSLGAGGAPDWSPKTNLIVFRAVTDEESGVGNFFTIRPDGHSLAQVTHFTGTVISHKVGFSPDGLSIVFSKAATGALNDVFTVSVTGADLRPVTHTTLADTSPDWGPTQ